MDSDNLRRVKQAWRRLEKEGHAVGMEALFEHCHPDCRFRPAAGGGETFHGVDDAREFFRRRRRQGADIQGHGLTTPSPAGSTARPSGACARR